MFICMVLSLELFISELTIFYRSSNGTVSFVLCFWSMALTIVS